MPYEYSSTASSIMKSRSDHAGYKPLVLDHGTAPSQSQPSKKWSRLWRVINFVMTIFFGLAAYVQVSDMLPDVVFYKQ